MRKRTPLPPVLWKDLYEGLPPETDAERHQDWVYGFSGDIRNVISEWGGEDDEETIGILHRAIAEVRGRLDSVTADHIADAGKKVGDLKPCPFCNGHTLMVPSFGHGVAMDKYRIVCNNPNCQLEPSSRPFNSEKEAIAAWNRRTSQPLRRWTAADSTPPDGLYLNYADAFGQIITHWDGRWRGSIYKHGMGKIMELNCDEEMIFKYYPCVYGPIEHQCEDGGSQ